MSLPQLKRLPVKSLSIAFSAALLLFSASLSASAEKLTFDLTPEQKGLVRTTADPELIKRIPENLKLAQPGKFTVAAAPTNPPVTAFATDSRTVIGFDPNLAQVVADKLGLELNLVTVAWADWPLGLTSGKYDAVISNVGVTEERKEKFDFSTYRKGLHGFFVRTDSKITAISEPKDIAGLRVVVDSGTAQERIMVEWNRLNQEAGLKPAELIFFDDEAAAELALKSGRVDVIVAPNARQIYEASIGAEKHGVGTLSAAWPLNSEVGITTRKDSGFGPLLTEVLEKLIQDGTYGKIASRWHLESEALEHSSFNPQGLPKYSTK